VARNPDPQLPLTCLTGATRTLDDWTTVFNLALVVLPDRPEARAFVPVIERIFATFGDSDVRTVVCVPSTAAVARRILGDTADRWLVFVDPDATLAANLGLERLPALVHLRQDTTLAGSAQGWSPTEWQKVVDELARSQHWTSPQVAGRGDPPPSPGWPIAS
jgi:hypothetical protein